ncbi:MAG: phosphatase PAP2 family protein [Eggerthellaceae bacterium]|nr:phosphatase PAP2 family protein [Eggerthellaceae bacterium]
MDISYLLTLQDLRMSLPGFVETILEYYSKIGDGPILAVLVLVVYWCVSKRAGQFALIAFASCNFISQLLKNILCVYRPWIRDTAIIPAQGSIEGAAGYSFPSGHTTGTGSALGSFAWYARKEHKWVTVVCAIAILLMMFSRNFLGVHTPQDVLVGLVLAIVMIAVANVFLKWIDRCDREKPGHNKDIIVMVIVLVVCAASVAFVDLKAYPMDYVNGALLVDPEAMQKGSFEAAGLFAGAVIGWVLERRLVGFTTDNLTKRMVGIRFVVGIIIFGGAYLGFDVLFKAIMPYNWAKLCAMLIVAIVAVFVVPLVFNRIEKRKK